jgi:hypothetical protein
MKRLLIAFLFLPLFSLAQKTIVIGGGSPVSGGGSSSGVTLAQLDSTADEVRSEFPTSVSAEIYKSSQRSVNFDSAKYNTSTVIDQIGNDRFFMFYNLAPTHVATGKLYLQTSRDAINWTDPVQPIIGDSVINDVGLLSTGVSGNRLHLSYQRGNDYSKVYSTYTDDFGATWSTPVVTTKRGAQNEIANYGRYVHLGGDTLFRPMYANWTAGMVALSYYDISYNNGDSWADYKVIMSAPYEGTFPNGGHVNETWMLKLPAGRLLAFVRSEKYYGYHFQFWSDDRGETWNSVAVQQGKWFSEYFATSGPNPFPVSARVVRDSLIYVYVGYRGNNVTGLLSGMKVVKGKLDAYKNPDLFGKPVTIYSPTTIKGEHNDFGYGYDLIKDQEPYLGIYDISVHKISGTSNTQTKTRGFIIPVEGNNYFEAYDTVSTVSIPSGTETRVTTPIIRLDSEGFYNADSLKPYFQRDGWHTASARVTFEPNAAGTYRRATLWMVDRGDETGLAPTAMQGKYLISRITIPPSTSDKLNTIELFGQIYAYPDMELRLTVEHDAGTNLLLINSDINKRTTVLFNKTK